LRVTFERVTNPESGDEPGLDFGVLILASAIMISIASALLGRLAR